MSCRMVLGNVDQQTLRVLPADKLPDGPAAGRA